MAERRSRRAAGPLMAALVALALTGCAADYVGDDWQCPLAQGTVCASVAAADPAVPVTREDTGFAAEIPRHGEGGRGFAPGSWPVTAGEPACDSGCDPFDWLAGLSAGPADPESGKTERADVARDSDTDAAEPTVPPRNGDVAPIAAAAGDDAQSPPPDEAVRDAGSDAASDPAAPDAHRTGEVVARIWIAPFVDADGIYREGSWVRAVIAPAAWRLP